MEYEQYKREMIDFEKYRQENKCCANCNNYYIEYGIEMCKVNDEIPDEDSNKSVCEYWK